MIHTVGISLSFYNENNFLFFSDKFSKKNSLKFEGNNVLTIYFGFIFPSL